MNALRVLVAVEDSESTATLTRLLAFYGHSLVAVQSVDEAKHWIASQTFALVLLGSHFGAEARVELSELLGGGSAHARLVIADRIPGEPNLLESDTGYQFQIHGCAQWSKWLGMVLRRLCGDIEVMLVGRGPIITRLHRTLRGRGYRVQVEAEVCSAFGSLRTVTASSAMVVVGENRVGAFDMDRLDAQLCAANLTYPLVCLSDGTGYHTPISRALRVQRFSVTAPYDAILTGVESGIDWFDVSH